MAAGIAEGTELTLSAGTSVITMSSYYGVHTVYVSEKGSDENGDGSEAKPFKSVLQAMRSVGKEPFPVIYVDNKDDSDKVII